MLEPQDVTRAQTAPDASPPPGSSTAEPTFVPAPPESEPDPAGPPSGSGPRGRPPGRTIGLAALAGIATVGVLAIGFALGSRADDATVPAASTAPAAERTDRSERSGRIVDAGWTSPDGRTEIRMDGRGGRGLAGGRGRGAITITAIDGTKLSLETENGWTRTIDAADATVTEGGQTVELSTLEVGDQVVFRETRDDDGTYTVTAIAVVQPSVAGTVASVSGSTVTVTTRDGASQKVTLTDATTYTLGRTDATKAAVVAGVRILARGSLGADGTLTAASVVVEPATAWGTVKEKSATSITLTTRDDATAVVKVTDATTYSVEGVESATLADIKVGAVVLASGTENVDGSLTATVVRSRAAGTDGSPGMGGGWSRGHGWGVMPGGEFPGWGPGEDAPPDAPPLPSGEGTNS